MRKISKLAFAGVSLLAFSAPAFAQAAPDEENADDSEIVVTGTLIRNTEVVGAQTISVSSEAILQKGANSTNELLALVPQISNTFNGRFEGDPRGIGAGISITKPNLRSLPGFNSSSGGLTLVMVDGVRPTPVGVNQSAIDVDVIPSAVLAGIDVLTDGGTSLYGADAVGGVINFRTMRKFEGLKVDANYGFGTTIKHFSQYDGSITAGHSWATGNAYISASYAHRDLIRNAETKWATGEIYSAAGVPRFASTECIAPVGSEIRYFHFAASATSWTNNPAAPGAGVFPTGTACDQYSSQTYVPKQERKSLYGAITQEFGDSIDLRVTGYWTKRRTELANYPRGYSTPAQTPVFPANAPVGSIFTVLGGIGFSFGANANYVDTRNRLGFDTWGVTPELTAKLGGDWQLKTTLHYGQSDNFQRFASTNGVLIQSYINSGALNPLNAAAASATVINDILDYENAQDTNQTFYSARAIVDGPLFELPAGSVKIAAGLEYQKARAELRVLTGRVNAINSAPYQVGTRNAKSAFAELSVPAFSFLDLTASVRYDDYSDFGSTTNPNFGATLKPASWLKIFGHWNTSYNAPTALDLVGIATGRFGCGAYSASNPPTDPLKKWNGQGDCFFLAEGASRGLRPQTAESWAVGFEVEPGHGFRFGGEFYSLDVKDVLGAVNPANANTYVTDPDLYIFNPSATFYSNLLSQLANGATIAPQLPVNRIALIVDRRTSNLSRGNVEGVDFHIYYDTTHPLGDFSFGINGTKLTKATLTTSGVANNQLGLGSPEVTATAFMGFRNGGWSARATANYSGQYHDSAADNVGQIPTSGSFIQTNLFLGYEFGEDAGALGGTSLRLNIDNVFDEQPTRVRRASTSFPNYLNWTLGRVVKLGFSKKF
jgi:iron complex outermembrane recepter protein